MPVVVFIKPVHGHPTPSPSNN